MAWRGLAGTISSALPRARGTFKAPTCAAHSKYFCLLERIDSRELREYMIYQLIWWKKQQLSLRFHDRTRSCLGLSKYVAMGHVYGESDIGHYCSEIMLRYS